MLIDTHVHLNAKQFKSNYDSIINEAIKTGVEYFIVVGFDRLTNKIAIELADKYDFIYAAVGWHPVDAKYATEEDFKKIEEMLNHPKVVAVGECGLDYHWDTSTKEEQFSVFKRQIEMAKKHKKPLIIHMRESTMDTYEILKEMDVSSIGGVMHCYSGSSEMAKRFIEIGMHISLGGPVTFKNGYKPKEVAKDIMIDKLLIETDSPYLAPHPYRGKQNEPKHVKLICEEIAKIRGISFEETAKITSDNAIKLFGIKE